METPEPIGEEAEAPMEAVGDPGAPVGEEAEGAGQGVVGEETVETGKSLPDGVGEPTVDVAASDDFPAETTVTLRESEESRLPPPPDADSASGPGSAPPSEQGADATD